MLLYHLYSPAQFNNILPCRWCCSVARLCPTLCKPMDCSTPGCPVLQYLPEFAQTHLHWVSDAIQPSHPLLSMPSLFHSFTHLANMTYWLIGILVFPPCSDESEVPQGQGLLASSQGGASFRFVGYCSCAQNDRICAWMDMPDTEPVLCRVLPYSSCFCDLCQTRYLFYKQQVSIFLCKESFKKQLASRWFLSLLY